MLGIHDRGPRGGSRVTTHLNQRPGGTLVQLRPYQEDAIDRTRAALGRVRSALLQAPTGAGKTAMAAAMSGTASNRSKRIYFVCHRAELVLQTSHAFTNEGIPHGFIARGWPKRPKLGVQICSIQTLGRRLARLPAPDLVILDECHHAAARTWSQVLEAWPNAYIVGLSATPERLDGKGLGDHFQELVLGPSVAWLMEHGYLSRYRLFAPPTALDLKGVRRRGGDFHKGDLDVAVNRRELVGDIVEHWKRHANGMRTLARGVSREHSEKIVAAFLSAGIPAAHIDGTTPSAERAAKLRALAVGGLQVVSNVELLGEGFDLSANAGVDCTVECVIEARPTDSLSMWLQWVGRALRPKPEPAIILDHVGNAMRHGLPDDEREWKLTAGRRSKKSEKSAPVRQCPKCYAVHGIVAPACTVCGHVYPIQAREVKEVEGTLEEVDKAAFREEQAKKAKQKAETRGAKTRDELIALGKRRDYDHPEAWADHILRERNEWREQWKRRRGRGAA